MASCVAGSSSSTASSSSASLHPSITENLVETKKFYCPFLERGFCRESSRCNFSHDHRNSIKIPIDYCHFYLANQCLYGQDCKFRHSEPILPNVPLPVDDHRFMVASTSGQTTPTPSDHNNYHHNTSGQTLPDDENYLYYEEDAGDEESQHLHYQYLDEIEFRDCDLCGRPCLHPRDAEQRRQHREDCLREHEREMELSFAVQRSKDKVCGICMDTVIEKKPVTSSRFGILEKCSHTFCLDCIRKWRGTKQFETRTTRACPECRVSSDFVVPSKYWVEDQDDKEKLIRDYKAALKSKPCRYFDQGKGECPFANSCFYKHAYPDGRLAVLEPPKPRRHRNFGSGSRGFFRDSVTNYILWNILTSTEDDDWSNDELESLYFDPNYGITDDEEDDDDDEEDDDDDEYEEIGDDESHMRHSLRIMRVGSSRRRSSSNTNNINDNNDNDHTDVDEDRFEIL